MKADRVLAVMFLAVFILQGTAYAQEPPKATFIHGKVIDDAGSPIEGAEAELIRQTDGAVIDSLITGADGLYIIKMKFGVDEGPVDVLIRVTKTGYPTYQEEIQIHGAAPPEIVEKNILLTEKSEEEEEAQPEISPNEPDALHETITNYEGPLEIPGASETTTSTATSSQPTTPTTETPPETPEHLENITGTPRYSTQPPDTPELEIISPPSSPEVANAPESKNVGEHSGQKAPSDHEDVSEGKKGILERGLEWLRGFLRRVFE